MDVIVVGAGPVGLMLAAELRLWDLEVAVLERLPAPTGFSKAGGLHARTAECLDIRGLLGDLRKSHSRRVPLAHFAGIRKIRLDRLDTSRPDFVGIPQAELEVFLEKRAVELGAVILRGQEVVGLAQDGASVRLSTMDGQTYGANYVVGCDGGRSVVRKLAGFSFDGCGPTLTGRLGDVSVPELHENPGLGWHRTSGGIMQITPARVVVVEFDGPPEDKPMTLDEFSSAVDRVAGRHVDIPAQPVWMSRFTDNTRLADDYRRGRVFLAGDAAHVHSPFGGQGLNLGLQDAMNLGWKLAYAVRGQADLLDTYAVERRPVAERVLHNTRAQVALMDPRPQVTPLREVFATMMDLPAVNTFLGEMISGLDVSYDCGGFAPMEVPREPFVTGRGVLLDATSDRTLLAAAEPWRDRVTALPGGVSMLVRPDGYVCWQPSAPTTLAAALHQWFGKPRIPA
ncbi:FAD-dependent monooxygenase [Fodinicola acaciae]|uniref:FAD-dependent monooxygenase n=1 Tax=Fodinicola acaciae TaxID=2681555 RepID=UPI0013D445D8|nr:FAD-dependent monooxygenase [Fodinicola acaciae]